MMNRRILLLPVIILVVLLCSGCEITPISEYMNNGDSSGLSDLQDGTYEGKEYSIDDSQYLAFCQLLRENFKKIMVACVIAGLLIYRVFRVERRIQQFALYVLIGGGMFAVPLVTYLICGFYYFLY